MEKQKPAASWLAAGAAGALLLGFILTRHPGALSVGSSPMPAATVPAELAANASAMPKASGAPQPTRLAIYVCGNVRRPGVYDMPSTARVADALARAGGALADADLEQLNLAEPLADAMKIDVLKKGEHLAFAGDSSSGGGAATFRRPNRHSGRSSHKLQPGQTLDVNTASEEELTALPGVGPGLARRIVEYRTQNGPFQSIDDLQNVSGIGPSKFEKLSPYVRL